MTDQKPDRQDGLLPCPFCGGEADYYPSNEAVFSVSWIGHIVHCKTCQARVQTTIGEKTAREMWNNRRAPPRDGAEGAGEDYDSVAILATGQRLLDAKFAPTKPAPDAWGRKPVFTTETNPCVPAMQNATVFQNALCDRIDAWRALPEYAEVALVDWLRDAGIIASPAPPADDSNSPAFDRASHNYGERLPSSDAAANVGETLSSPAVAAEPVALREAIAQYSRDLRRNSSGGDDYPWEIMRGVADYLDVLLQRMPAPPKPAPDAMQNSAPPVTAAKSEPTASQIDAALRGWFSVKPSSAESDSVLERSMKAALIAAGIDASPPVRGDREAYARAICEADGRDYDDELELATKFETLRSREIISRANRYANAILSVQSGAGEREMPSDLSDGLPHLNRNE